MINVDVVSDWLRITQVNVSLRKEWLHAFSFHSCTPSLLSCQHYHIRDLVISKIRVLGFLKPLSERQFGDYLFN